MIRRRSPSCCLPLSRAQCSQQKIKMAIGRECVSTVRLMSMGCSFATSCRHMRSAVRMLHSSRSIRSPLGGLAESAANFVPVLLTLYTCFAAVPLLMQNKLLYLGSREYDEHPAQHDLDFEDVEITTVDGVRLHCWLLRHKTAAKETRAKETPLVLHFHGNAGNISHRLWQTKKLLDAWNKTAAAAGLEVLLVGYRGYGRSDGSPCEEGLQKDAAAALEYASDRSAGPVFLYGESLGGAVAVQLAASQSANPSQVAGLVVQNTFTSVSEMIRRIYPHLYPLTLLPGNPLLLNKWDSAKAAKSVDTGIPVLFLSGRKDELISPEMHDQLYSCLEQNQAEASMVRFEQSGHNDTVLAAGYHETVAAFLMANTPSQSPQCS